MSVSFRCPNPECGKRYTLKHELIGKKVQCSKCWGTFRITREQADKLIAKSKKKQESSSTTIPEAAKQKPRKRRRPRQEEILSYEDVEVVEYNPVVDDTYDDPTPWNESYRAETVAHSDSNFKMISVGFLIIAIGNCIMCGSLAADYLRLGLLQVAHVMVKSAGFGIERIREEERERGVPSSRQEMRDRRLTIQKKMEGYQSRIKTALNLVKGTRNIHLTATWIALIASVIITVGYGFLFKLPNRNSAFTLGIAVFCLAVISLLLRFIFTILPILDNDIKYAGFIHPVGSLLDSEIVVKALIWRLVISAESIFLAFCLLAIVKIKRSDINRGYAEKLVIFSIVFASLTFLLGLLGFVEWESSAILYLVWFVGWIAIGFQVLFVVYLLRYLFRMRMKVSSLR